MLPHTRVSPTVMETSISHLSTGPDLKGRKTRVLELVRHGRCVREQKDYRE